MEDLLNPHFAVTHMCLSKCLTDSEGGHVYGRAIQILDYWHVKW